MPSHLIRNRPNHQPNRRTVFTALGALLLDLAASPFELRADASPDWTTPLPPYRIVGNLYYVGSRDLASFLITTPQGHILINSNLTTSPPQIRTSVEKLGFRWHDVKILLISHAHFDHGAGSAEIKKQTGARYMVLDTDVADVESGGQRNFHYWRQKAMFYPATKVDRILHDGDQVQLGATTLVAHKTAGHTKGCTTWTMVAQEKFAQEKARSVNVVIVGSPNLLPGYNLIDDPGYPQMAADFEQQFRTLKALPCDIFLGAHGIYYNMLEKYAKLQSGDTHAFFDSEGYRKFVAEHEQTFQLELTKQKKAHPM
jgi:metallo-beta-lactamase class B